MTIEDKLGLLALAARVWWAGYHRTDLSNACKGLAIIAITVIASAILLIKFS